MTVKLKQDRTRRSGYKGSLNAQDWPKEKQVLDRLALAQSNITNAEISLEIAAGCLKRAEKAIRQREQRLLAHLRTLA